MGVEFGEAVLCKRKPVGGGMGEFTCLWEDGIYGGARGSPGEVVANHSGAWRARTVHRKPQAERWGSKSVEMVVFLASGVQTKLWCSVHRRAAHVPCPP